MKLHARGDDGRAVCGMFGSCPTAEWPQVTCAHCLAHRPDREGGPIPRAYRDRRFSQRDGAIRAWLEETPFADGGRMVFVRLVPRGDTAARRVDDTIEATAAHVDVDAHGVVLGVTLFLPHVEAGT